MTNEEELKSSLCNEFPFLADSVAIKRQRRIFLSVSYERFPEVLGYAKTKLGFLYLSAITGLDEGQNLSVIYHLSRKDGAVLSIKTGVSSENPVIKTLTPIFPCADMYERELADLFGFIVEGLPEGYRYPLTDEWPSGEYPLRKAWKPKSVQGASNA